jgi:predicted outer membrane repeat protein
MKRNEKMVMFSVIALLIALIQGAYGGIQVTASGGGNGESGSVSMNYETSKSADVKSQIAINGATVTPSTAIKGPIAKFEETHAVTDDSGKSASVYVKVLNAPKGLTYASQVLPGEGNVDTKPQISAEQWLTVPKADSIKCKATASYGILSANVGLDEYKGTLKGDYVTLTGYYGKAVTTDALVLASQIATSGTANSIKIYGNATDSSGTYNVDTSLMGLSGGKATFAALSMSSSAGTTNQVEQNEHLHGTFTSTATYTPTIGTAQTKTMNSNYGTEYDLNMKAAQGSLPTGSLGYYVKLGTTASKIQGAVNAAQSGDTINVAAGKYAENVNLNKVLTLKGAGNPTATSFALNAILGTGSGGITAPIIYVNPTAKIQDGVNLASLKGTVNVAAGTYIENVQIDKSVTVNGAGQSTTIVDGNNLGSVFKIGSTNSNIDVILSGLGITGGSGTLIFGDIKSGGGIYNKGRTTIKNSRIFANSATTCGGIGNFGTATISGSTISGNSANVGGGVGNSGTMTITGITISGNSATQGGGVSNQGIATISGSTISGNTATTKDVDGMSNAGGGIANSGFLTVTGSTISGNSASKDGGGIANIAGYYSGSTFIPATLIVQGASTISENTAQYGGGIYNDGKTTIKTSVISGNIANSDTGFTGGGGIVNWNTMNVMDSTISGNTAALNGGGIANPGTLTVQRCTISSNTAQQRGGGIASSGTLTVTGGTISKNSANMGGGIANGGTLTVTGGTISENSANMGGGGIANFNGGTMTVQKSTISRNSAMGTSTNPSRGGGILNDGKATITSSTISTNSALQSSDTLYGEGGGIYNGGFYDDSNFIPAVMTIQGDSTISNNYAGYGGGIRNAGTLTVQKGIISGNNANDGGGIFNWRDGTLYLTGTSQIVNNQATTGYGGGIFSTNSHITFDGTKVVVKSNKAHQPDTLPDGTPWYQQYGVFVMSDTDTPNIPTTKNGFNPAKQVTGNTYL